MDPYHGTVYTHEWLLKAVRNKVKTMELNRNADLVLKNINSSLTPLCAGYNNTSYLGKVRTQEKKGKNNKHNGGAADDNNTSTVAGPQGPAGKGNGKQNKDRTPKPPTDERLAIVKEHADIIKKQGLCLKFNQGTCTNTDCKLWEALLLDQVQRRSPSATKADRATQRRR